MIPQFTGCRRKKSDGEWFSQALNGRFLQFALMRLCFTSKSVHFSPNLPVDARGIPSFLNCTLRMAAENNSKHLSSGPAHPHEEDSIALGGDVASSPAQTPAVRSSSATDTRRSRAPRPLRREDS